MKDNNRSCVKCKSNTTQDSNLVLHRFPKPASKPNSSNMQRAEGWAKFCYPMQNWKSPEFQKMLYTSHKMLCDKHFPESAFVEDAHKNIKLHHYAVPSESSIALVNIDSQNDTEITSAKLNNTSEPRTSKSCGMDTDNDTSELKMTSTKLAKISHLGTSKLCGKLSFLRLILLVLTGLGL